jgi:glycosyltransferase involved in cell wall biosynthesis
LRLLEVRRPPLKKHGLRLLWDVARNLPMRRPYMAMAHRTSAMQEAVAVELAARPYDLLHVEWTPYVENVPPGTTLPVTVGTHNVEADIWQRLAEATPWGPKRLVVAAQARKVARYEREVLARADAVTAVSAHDADRIRALSGAAHVTVVENGVDPAYFAPQPDVRPEPASAVFTGALDWRANQDGVLWFVDEVLPRVKARRPEARFVVVGRHPPAGFVERLGGAGVTVHATVPDVRPHVAGAAVSVVPLRVGGGTRLKICEALAMERLVVSTTVGAEGLALDQGIVRADTPEAFAAQLLAAWADPSAAQARARAGRAQVLARYGWDAIAPNLVGAWREAVARGARGGNA